MISTFSSYALDTKDMAATLKRVGSAPATKAEIAYYNANIGKVKNVDGFLADYKLYSYAMKAYGLQDMIYAKAFMKKVLTSDLSDTASFASRLNDPRYKQIAAAFNFGKSATPTAQTTQSEAAMFGTAATKTSPASTGLYQQSFTAEESAATIETNYYESTIGTVKSVDDLLGDARLRNYVLQANGIDPTVVSNSFLRSMLTSDVNDPTSFVNVNGSAADKTLAAQFNFTSDGSIAVTTADADKTYYEANIASVRSVSDLAGDPRLFDYVKVAFALPQAVTSSEFISAFETSGSADQYGLSQVLGQFNFQKDGTVPANEPAQTADKIAVTSGNYATNYRSQAQGLSQKSDVMRAYNTVVPSFVTDAAASADTAYYRATIGSVSSISQLTQDPSLFDYIKLAYHLQAIEPNASDATLKYDLQASVEDPNYARLTGLSSVISQFNFQSDGSVAAGEQAQSSSDAAAAIDAFQAAYTTQQASTETEAIANYEKRISSVKKIDQFFASNATADTNAASDKLPELYQMALRSYGIGENEISRSQMKKILESDPYDPSSYVSKLKDSRFIALAKAFNFDSSGTLRQPVTALSTTQIDGYVSQYSRNVKLGLSGAALTKAVADAKKAATYFATTMPGITDVSDLLKDSKLTDFLLKAGGIDPKTVSASDLKKAFTSDPAKPNSFVNSAAATQLKPIVDAFNFDSAGELVDSKIGPAENKAALETTNDLFLHQTLEAQAGQTNDGVRLALYFQRKAPSISSVYDIMADSALYKVLTTTFGLSSGVSSMKVDAQAKLLGKLINVTDLHDPTKLNAFLKRFSVQYDLKSGTASSASPAVSILQRSSKSVGINANTMLAVAQLKA